ncbi:MAG: hypothetical protein HZC55_16830 [Verrucomicrobia bacterium]|nr:hypothetical protein [Verrucomicrobiota bacterium]
MFRVTLCNFDAASGQASAEFGSMSGGFLSSGELQELLERFAAVDPIQNADAEPEIGIEVRRRRHLVRTGQGRLFLYDPRNALEPALVLTPAEVIAELDGSAAAARTRAPFSPLAAPAPEVPATPPGPTVISPLRRIHRIAVSAVALACAVYLAAPLVITASARALPDRFTFLSDPARIEATLQSVSGVYMTGSRPGHHGIAVAADGSIKLFQLNRQGIPSLLNAHVRVGTLEGETCLIGDEFREPIRFRGKGVLVFCGETYQRIQ